MPQLQHQQRPQIVSVAAAAFVVIADQFFKVGFVEVAATERVLAQEVPGQEIVEVLGHPAVDGDTEAHLLAGEDFGREEITEGFFEDEFAVEEAHLEAGRER